MLNKMIANNRQKIVILLGYGTLLLMLVVLFSDEFKPYALGLLCVVGMVAVIYRNQIVDLENMPTEKRKIYEPILNVLAKGFKWSGLTLLGSVILLGIVFVIALIMK